MDFQSWRRLFESFRPEDHELLVISAEGGLEVAAQNICRVEDELVFIRGRISGQAESGRLFILPFSKINTVYVNRPVILEEVELFSPTATAERKQKVAAMVAELAASAKQEAKDLERTGRSEQGANTPINLKEQLERMREQAGFGRQNGAGAPPNGAATPSGAAIPTNGASAHAAPTNKALTLGPGRLTPSSSPGNPPPSSVGATPTLPPRLSAPKLPAKKP